MNAFRCAHVLSTRDKELLEGVYQKSHLLPRGDYLYFLVRDQAIVDSKPLLDICIPFKQVGF